MQVVPFDDVAEQIHYITASSYGQQVSLFGQDPRQMSQLVDPLVNEVSRVNLKVSASVAPMFFLCRS